MSIKSKVIAGTSAMAISIGLLGFLIVQNQKETQNKIDNILAIYQKRIELARNLQEDLIRLSRAERNYLLFDDPAYVENILSLNGSIKNKL
jgi:CHASE3 domain sensor protein